MFIWPTLFDIVSRALRHFQVDDYADGIILDNPETITALAARDLRKRSHVCLYSSNDYAAGIIAVGMQVDLTDQITDKRSEG